MSAIATFTIPTDSFPLGSAFKKHPDATMELERVVPTNKSLIPYIWVHGVSKAEECRIESTFEEGLAVRGVKLLDEVEGDYLLRVKWEAGYNGVMKAIAETPVTLISGGGDSEQWTFELRGDERADIAEFQEHCRNRNLPVTLTALHPLGDIATGAEYGLTATQREALVLAYERGYYQSPRETTLQEMADDLGITGQALGARLQGGIHHLIGGTLSKPN